MTHFQKITNSRKDAKTQKIEHLTFAWLRLCVAIFAGMPVLLPAQSEHFKLKKADRFYDEKKWADAERTYRDAGAFFNAGNAAYQRGNFAAAADFFSKTAENERLAHLQPDAFFNLGNALLMQEKYAEAIEAYQTALRLQPNAPDAKKNLQLAKNKLRQQPPPPPPPEQKPPPPLSQPPQATYLDRAQPNRQREAPQREMPPDAARKLLEAVVVPEEQKNSRTYRQLVRRGGSGDGRKDW